MVLGEFIVCLFHLCLKICDLDVSFWDFGIFSLLNNYDRNKDGRVGINNDLNNDIRFINPPITSESTTNDSISTDNVTANPIVNTNVYIHYVDETNPTHDGKRCCNVVKDKRKHHNNSTNSQTNEQGIVFSQLIGFDISLKTIFFRH